VDPNDEEHCGDQAERPEGMVVEALTKLAVHQEDPGPGEAAAGAWETGHQAEWTHGGTVLHGADRDDHCGNEGESGEDPEEV
jgi:hypothetical protein